MVVFFLLKSKFSDSGQKPWTIVRLGFSPVQDLFVFHVDSVTELGLAANTPYPVSRLKWDTDGGASHPSPPSHHHHPHNHTIIITST